MGSVEFMRLHIGKAQWRVKRHERTPRPEAPTGIEPV
jgi:hypothetical protein